MGKRGPKGKFNEKVREAFLRLIKEGKTEDEIGEILGVTRRTLNNWKGKHKDLLYAVRESRQAADELIEASLYRRALGYSHPEEKVMQYEGCVITHETLKHYPPDTQAAMFWLRNRQPARWKEKTDGDVTINNNLSLGKLTDDQLEARIEKLLAKKAEP